MFNQLICYAVELTSTWLTVMKSPIICKNKNKKKKKREKKKEKRKAKVYQNNYR